MQKIIIIILIVLISASISYTQVEKIIAIVNNEVITNEDIDIYLEMFDKNSERNDQDNNKENTRKDALERLIEGKLMIAQAKRRESQLKEEQKKELNNQFGKIIAKRIEELKSEFKGEDDFDTFIRVRGLTINDLENRYREKLLMDWMVEEYIYSKIKISPREITDYYINNKDKFTNETKFHVLALTSKTDEELLQLKIKLENAKTPQQIRDIFNDLENANRIDLGLITKDELEPGISDNIFSLKKGQYSSEFKKDDLYYIFFIEDIELACQIPLVEVRRDINNVLFDMKVGEKLNKWISELKSKAIIIIKDEAYK